MEWRTQWPLGTVGGTALICAKCWHFYCRSFVPCHWTCQSTQWRKANKNHGFTMKIIFLSRVLWKRFITLVLFYFQGPPNSHLKGLLRHENVIKKHRNSMCERDTHLVCIINNVKTQLITLFSMCSNLGIKLFKYVSFK